MRYSNVLAPEHVAFTVIPGLDRADSFLGVGRFGLAVRTYPMNRG